MWYNRVPVNQHIDPRNHQRSNSEWLADLDPQSPQREAAIADLREYLLRAVLVYLTRHRSDLSVFDYDEIRQFAEDWAQQALIQVIDHRDTFRGDSKFTTWAYRIAVNLAAGELRRKRWENLSLDRLTEAEAPDISLREDTSAPPPEDLLSREQIWQTIQDVIQHDLTDRQRTVITRIIIEGVPVEVVADDLGTNRNNIYKLVHDARRKLKRALESRGWSADDVLSAFAPSEA
ncbi:MAG: RNA polymerase sigma factor [Anaerolineae bacterium]